LRSTLKADHPWEKPMPALARQAQLNRAFTVVRY
jgi:hypothetical protein